MRQKLYGNHITPACETCVHGQRSFDGKVVLCPRRGAMPLYERCRKYEYDPLKRIPHRAPKQAAHTAEEFSLE
ncbi:MAG: hypothetical protein E7549_06815 [Ruminococcaceae bacterium]|nr:hypothetical protein [Oscillospiraceae bacterium]